MKLGSDGDVLELSIVGYQFPDAPNPQQRYSWHMIQGRAHTAHETWNFRWQALTCDESGRLVTWLREVADATAQGSTTPESGPRREWFTEPNLTFEVVAYRDGLAVLQVELDMEFLPPREKPHRSAGNPTILEISASPEQLTTAAAELASDLSRYPDGLAANG